jgi:hypothetical protein
MPNEIAAALINAIATVILAVPATLIAIAANRINSSQERLERNKAERELFETFNARFDKLNEDLNAIRRSEPLRKKRRTAEDVAQDYLNLCSEEYLWHTRGLIKDDVWKVWLRGVEYYLDTPGTAIVTVFTEEMSNAAAGYYGLFDCKIIVEKLKQHSYVKKL